eukprot:1156237-Pelagomonas_calceolata.AAC.2
MTCLLVPSMLRLLFLKHADDMPTHAVRPQASRPEASHHDMRRHVIRMLQEGEPAYRLHCPCVSSCAASGSIAC